MSSVAVVTDTTQYLPAEAIARHGIHLVSLYVNWNGRTDREADLPDYDGYYDRQYGRGGITGGNVGGKPIHERVPRVTKDFAPIAKPVWVE